MCRILLATEGPSDEVVGTRLVEHLVSGATVVCKTFPARGIQVVLRTLPTLLRAAHFGHYDWLVIHFDLDDSLPGTGSVEVEMSPLWQHVRDESTAALNALSPASGRTAPVRLALMAPNQSMDTWLLWGCNGGHGPSLERLSRHTLKEALYGKPPRKMKEKAVEYAEQLIAQMQNNDAWPASLKFFANQCREST
jgi:hypothetical protein